MKPSLFINFQVKTLKIHITPGSEIWSTNVVYIWAFFHSWIRKIALHQHARPQQKETICNSSNEQNRKNTPHPAQSSFLLIIAYSLFRAVSEINPAYCDYGR